MTDIQLSIIIPTYNVERYIEKCLESVFANKELNIQTIIIDDGSTDNTLNVIDAYLKKSLNKNTEVIALPHRGSAAISRNVGIKYAKGTYLLFLDSDDYLNTDNLKYFYDLIVTQDADVLVANLINFNTSKEWFNKNFQEKIFNENITTNLMLKPELMINLGPCNKIYKRRFIQDLDINFNENITNCEDQIFVLKTYVYSNKIIIDNNLMYYYRKREDDSNKSITQILNLKSLKEAIEAQKLNIEIIKNYNSKLISNLLSARLEYDILRHMNYMVQNKIEKDIMFKEVESFFKMIPLAYILNMKNTSAKFKLKIILIRLKVWKYIYKFIYNFKHNN